MTELRRRVTAASSAVDPMTGPKSHHEEDSFHRSQDVGLSAPKMLRSRYISVGVHFVVSGVVVRPSRVVLMRLRRAQHVLNDSFRSHRSFPLLPRVCLACRLKVRSTSAMFRSFAPPLFFCCFRSSSNGFCVSLGSVRGWHRRGRSDILSFLAATCTSLRMKGVQLSEVHRFS